MNFNNIIICSYI